MWHQFMAMFQTRQDINNDARQHPDTNFSLFSLFSKFCSRFSFFHSFFLVLNLQTTQSWMNHVHVWCYACMSTQHVRLKLLFIFIHFFYSFTHHHHPIFCTYMFSKPEHLFFPVIYFISNLYTHTKKWHDERLAIILQARIIKCIAWHNFYFILF